MEIVFLSELLSEQIDSFVQSLISPYISLWPVSVLLSPSEPHILFAIDLSSSTKYNLF